MTTCETDRPGVVCQAEGTQLVILNAHRGCRDSRLLCSYCAQIEAAEQEGIWVGSEHYRSGAR